MERTQRDERIDEAIEVLIAEDTEGFVTVGVGSEGVHLVQSAEKEEQLLAVWALATQVMEEAREGDIPLTPPDVLALAAEAAADRGLIPDDQL
jgi:hypothetical protein